MLSAFLLSWGLAFGFVCIFMRLWKTYRGDKGSNTVADAELGAMKTIVIEVPEGTTPGALVHAQTPHGRTVAFEAPMDGSNTVSAHYSVGSPRRRASREGPRRSQSRADRETTAGPCNQLQKQHHLMIIQDFL